MHALKNESVHAVRVFALLAWFFASSSIHAAPTEPAKLSDGFETGALAKFWMPGNYGSGFYAPGTVRLSTNYARSGRSSAELTVHQGDVAQPGDDNTITERTELNSGFFPLRGQEIGYGFSFLVPRDFPVADVRLVISSCKQSDVSRPLLAERFRNGKHFVTIECQGKKKAFRMPAIKLGQWNDMIFHVRYAEQDGLVEAWMNGKKVISYKGPFADPMKDNRFYHKIGLYRDKFRDPMTIYFDNYTLGHSLAEVDPARFK